MKSGYLLFAVLSAAIFLSSCDKNPTPPPGNNPDEYPFTVTASVDGSEFSAGASMTITPYVQPPLNLINILSTASGGRKLELSFFVQQNSTTLSGFNCTYSEGATASWMATIDSSTVSLSSFSFSPSDTTFTGSFSCRAWGGVSGAAQSMKNITLGSVITN